MFDSEKIRTEFPIFKNQPELVYLDSAATSLKPESVIAVISDYYSNYSANVHRGIYDLSERATAEYESARRKVAEFCGAKPTELVFTAGATAAANLVIAGYVAPRLGAGDVVISSVAEHHSNFLPLQQLALKSGAELKLLGLAEDYNYDYAQLEVWLREYGERVKCVALSAVSNVLGNQLDTSRVAKLITEHTKAAVFVLDAAQLIGHQQFNFASSGVHFCFFSGHKVLAETGIGVLLAKHELLAAISPTTFGGGTVSEVSEDKLELLPGPQRLEAGTPHISGAISLGAAVDYLHKIGMAEVEQHLAEVSAYARAELEKIEWVKVYGPKSASSAVVSFTAADIHPHDIAAFLNDKHIAVRAGQHCTQILHREVLEIPGTVRVSPYIYNSKADIAKLVTALSECINYYTELRGG
jgi:cysteine desulfurase/selenocysteine lyase